ncbi:4436_t:CDS:2 [Paraglomus occultum]|uniref:propanoyl-CoA C-acyltransferase n=1 Tax=Paraglomus occultum TaxID=144539 RepID=A0A9N8ZWW1_9GLOM|nr:4436_t:CDS:2 [Paraglomus occultum]
MPSKAYVIGVGITQFLKPQNKFDYPGTWCLEKLVNHGTRPLTAIPPLELVLEATTKALIDANITYDSIQQAFVGYCYGDSASGQRALYQLGMTQIPVINVNNNCSTGSTALFMARQVVQAGIVDCALALGFEKMTPGPIKSMFEDRTNPLDQIFAMTAETRGIARAPLAAQIFGNAGLEYCEKYGATPEHMARIAEKNHRHSVANPYSQFRDAYTLDQIKASPRIYGPLTKLQCCPTSDGAGAVIVASESFVLNNKLSGQVIEIVSQAMATDSPDVLSKKSAIELSGAGMTRRAANIAFKSAGIGPDDVKVVELHDCFSANELITYDALGLCKPGEAHKLVETGDNTYGGKYVINPSGGLISKGHPLGATGLAQCTELVWQLRGWCGDRQVSNIEYALQHNIGLGGAAVVTIYRRAKGLGKLSNEDQKTPLENHAYNPAVEARGISEEDVHRVMSKKFSERFSSRL